MMKYIVVGILAFFTITAGCSSQTDAKKATSADGKTHKITKQYTCTMHPDVLKNKPGVCPKCGMDLVEKDN
jgi:nitrous oxide reductase accessory protein NosL